MIASILWTVAIIAVIFRLARGKVTPGVEVGSNDYELVKDALGEMLTRRDHDVHAAALTLCRKIDSGRLVELTALELYALRVSVRRYAETLAELGMVVEAEALRSEGAQLEQAWKMTRKVVAS